MPSGLVKNWRGDDYGMRRNCADGGMSLVSAVLAMPAVVRRDDLLVRDRLFLMSFGFTLLGSRFVLGYLYVSCLRWFEDYWT
jgi:hypothetical protein